MMASATHYTVAITGFFPERRYVLRADGYSDIELQLEGDAPAWLLPTLSALAAILQLPEGWNSYRASRISPDAVGAALRVLSKVMQAQTPAPAVVPLSDGGVQFEWHRHGIDLELAIDAAGNLSGYCADQRAGLEWDEEDLQDVTVAAETLAILTERG